MISEVIIGTTDDLPDYNNQSHMKGFGIRQDDPNLIIKDKVMKYFFNKVFKCELEHYNDQFTNYVECMANSCYQILSDIHTICERHNLKYWLEGGSLLGSVRHGGIIPWDNDIDIGMFESDYKVLEKVISEYLPYIISSPYDVVNIYEKDGDKYKKCVTEDTLYELEVNTERKKDCLYFTKNKGNIISDVRLLNSRIIPNSKIDKDTRLECCCDIFIYPDEAGGFCGRNDPSKDLYEAKFHILKCYFLEGELFPLKKGKFGPLSLYIPNKPEVYLERVYGDWKTPKRYYDISHKHIEEEVIKDTKFECIPCTIPLLQRKLDGSERSSIVFEVDKDYNIKMVRSDVYRGSLYTILDLERMIYIPFALDFFSGKSFQAKIHRDSVLLESLGEIIIKDNNIILKLK